MVGNTPTELRHDGNISNDVSNSRAPLNDTNDFANYAAFYFGLHYFCHPPSLHVLTVSYVLFYNNVFTRVFMTISADFRW